MMDHDKDKSEIFIENVYILSLLKEVKSIIDNYDTHDKGLTFLCDVAHTVSNEKCALLQKSWNGSYAINLLYETPSLSVFLPLLISFDNGHKSSLPTEKQEKGAFYWEF